MWLTWVHEDQAPLLTQVRTVDLAAFRTHLIHEQGHPPATVNRRLQGLRLLFRWLVDRNWMMENPTTHLRFMRKSGTPQPLDMGRREVFALLHAAAASPHKLALRNVALVQLMVQAGLRVGEVTALTHADLTLKTRAGTVCVRDGKGRKAREVPLNTTVRRAVQDYLATQPEASAGAPIFRSKRGTSLAIRSVQAVVARLAQEASIERIPVSAQTLRHTFARYYLQQPPANCVSLPMSWGMSPWMRRRCIPNRHKTISPPIWKGARSMSLAYERPTAPGVLQHTAPRLAVFSHRISLMKNWAFNWTLSERDIN